jgi:hypothetical protein
VSPARLAIVGARRVRQGLGPFVASHLCELGAEVPCFLASRPETVSATERSLAEEHGVAARGYADLGELLARESIDALVILSPNETHARYLERALEAGLHVLCEKPLLWDVPDPAGRARSMLESFAEAGLLLRENCLWPHTLASFAKLYPGVLEEPLTSFSMRLSPISKGQRMLVDSISHPLSLLQALVPESPGRILRPRFEPRPSAGLAVHFTYETGAGPVAVEVVLVPAARPPRQAGYALNGHRVERRIRVSDYGLSFQADERSVPVPDPLRELLRGFLAELNEILTGGRKPATSSEIAERMAMLQDIVDAFGPEVGR